MQWTPSIVVEVSYESIQPTTYKLGSISTMNGSSSVIGIHCKASGALGAKCLHFIVSSRSFICSFGSTENSVRALMFWPEVQTIRVVSTLHSYGFGNDFKAEYLADSGNI